MGKRFLLTCWAFFLLILFCNTVIAQDPIKWSAPMNHYPEQWSPTAAPPQYNPYGYSYPYGAYGYDGYGQNQAYSYGYGAPAQQYGGQYSGNPYYYYGR